MVMGTKPTPEGFTSGLIGKAYRPIVEQCKTYSRLLGVIYIIVDTLEPLDSWVYKVSGGWREEQIDSLVLECCQSVQWRWL
jgi:hypothetical protein